MKTIEELKKEQYDAKAKLHELIEFINGEEFYNLSQSEKNIIGQRRVALEMYLNSFTKQIYDKEGVSFDTNSAVWPLLLSSIFSTPMSFGSGISNLKDTLEEKDFDDNDLTDSAQ